ncbi:terminase small subunit [Sporosarcina sp. SAFN-010]|uniref:terminase small subunit n=1 Tax=Sporosarcina sp. SAFN-010 TaxID=3387273 RepID=UPI003F805804
MTNWEEIQNEWEASDISFKELAEKHGLKDSTIRSRKNREKWQRGNVERNATPTTQRKKNVATKKEEFEPVVESVDITDKQRLFCLYYIKCFNATKAYQKAYDCSYSVANVEGYRTLVKPSIEKEIRRLKAEMQSELFLDATDIAREYLKMAFADITDFLAFGTREVPEYDAEGEPLLDSEGKPETRTVSFVEFKDYTEVDGTMIQEIKQGRDGVSIKLYDKHKAMQELDKRLLSMDQLKVQKLKAEIEKLNSADDNEAEKDVAAALRGLVNGINAKAD